MIGSPARVSALSVTLPSPPLPLPALIELALEHLAVARHEKAKSPIDRRDKHIGFGSETLPIRVGERVVGGIEQIKQPDDEDERSPLEGTDEVVDEGRNHHRQCLRQNNQASAAPIPETERIGGLVLSPRDRLQTTADDFGKIRSGEQNKGDLGTQQLVYS